MVKTMSMKFSAGPNFSATEENGTASKVSATTLIVPATKEPTAATASAAPARPLRAMG